jgi:uncharacterized membrane protein HdeD (DUF308 family)
MSTTSLSRMLVLRGVLAVVFGVLALFWPRATVLALALLFGVYALVNGIGLIMSGFRQRVDQWQRVAHVVGGVLGIAVGVITLFWPGITAFVLVIMIGAWALVNGLLEIWGAIRLRREVSHEWFIILVGALSVLAGILILVRPGVGAIAIAQVIGIYAIIAGVLMLISAWRLRKAIEPRAPSEFGRPAQA